MSTEEIISLSVPATRWRNSTNDTLSFDLNVEGVHLDRITGKLIPTKTRHVVVHPGEEVVLPSEFDRAIQNVKDGKSQSGLAPQLIRMHDGAPTPTPAHPALLGLSVIPTVTRSIDSAAREERLRARRAQ